jgi:hypothetical protein
MAFDHRARRAAGLGGELDQVLRAVVRAQHDRPEVGRARWRELDLARFGAQRHGRIDHEHGRAREGEPREAHASLGIARRARDQRVASAPARSSREQGHVGGGDARARLVDESQLERAVDHVLEPRPWADPHRVVRGRRRWFFLGPRTERERQAGERCERTHAASTSGVRAGFPLLAELRDAARCRVALKIAAGVGSRHDFTRSPR